MEAELKDAIGRMDKMTMEQLEEIKDRCGRQVLIWATTDKALIEKHKSEVMLCRTLVNRYGELLLAQIEKPN